MATAKTPIEAKDESSKPLVLLPDEARILFDRLARRYLQMSGDEFLRAWDAGKFPDPDRPAVMRVAILIPFVRPE